MRQIGICGGEFSRVLLRFGYGLVLGNVLRSGSIIENYGSNYEQVVIPYARAKTPKFQVNLVIKNKFFSIHPELSLFEFSLKSRTKNKIFLCENQFFSTTPSIPTNFNLPLFIPHKKRESFDSLSHILFLE